MEPTTTLQQLRRAIARELEMPFFRRYKNGFLTADSGSTTELTDADLTQRDKFWNGDWVYRIASQEASPITNFNVTDNKAVLEIPITAFASNDQYEIHSLWNAYEIHDAINRAIHDSRRIFFETITDETLIVTEDKLIYSLSSLAKTPHIIQKVWLEQPTSVKRGLVQSSTATRITVESANILIGVNSTWLVSIYAGTGAGQLRAVSSTSGEDIIVAAWTTQPDGTSKYALWNPTQQLYDWKPWTGVRYDSMKEFPAFLYFSHRPVNYEGLRIRLEYTSLPSELSTEADTTVIPDSFLIPAAISIMHGRKVKETKADRELHFAESKRYKDEALAWLVQNAPHRPDSDVFSQAAESYQPDSSDPLNWMR